MKTGLIISDTYKNHDTGDGHPEKIDRVTAVIENFKKIDDKNLIWKKPAKFNLSLIKYQKRTDAPLETPTKKSKGSKFPSIKLSTTPKEKTPLWPPPSTISAVLPILSISLSLHFYINLELVICL